MISLKIFLAGLQSMQISTSLTDTNRYLLCIAASVVATMQYIAASVIEQTPYKIGQPQAAAE